MFRILKIKEKAINAYLEYEELIKNKEISFTQVEKLTNVDRHIISKIYNLGYIKLESGVYIYNNESVNIYREIESMYEKDKYLNFAKLKRIFGIKRETFLSAYKTMNNKDFDINNNRKVSFDRCIFNNIDNEEKAYWLGFILADGNIYRNELRLKISEKDENHIKKFIKFVNGKEDELLKEQFHTITGNRLVNVTLCDRFMINKLAEYGLHPNKTNKEIPYYGIEKELRRHYIRGIFDGDGHIRSDLSSIGVCGSKEVLTFIQDTICEDLKISKSTTIYKQEKTKDNELMKLGFFKDRKEVAKYLYKDSKIYLDRKYKLYEEMCK